MDHAYRACAREKFAQSIGLITSATVKNAERSIYNWAVQETRDHCGDPSWENPQFRSRYKQKLHGLVQELTRGEAVDVSLQVVGDHVNFSWKIVPQLVYRLKRKELEARKETVLSTIREQGQLTPELEARIRETAGCRAWR